MARLRSSLTPAPAPAVATEEAAQRRWEVARWLFGASVQGSPAHDAHIAIRAEHGRLASLDLTAVERLAALDAFLGAHGWLDAAYSHYRHRERTTR